MDEVALTQIFSSFSFPPAEHHAIILISHRLLLEACNRPHKAAYFHILSLSWRVSFVSALGCLQSKEVNQLTDSMELSPSSEAGSCSLTQKALRILMKPERSLSCYKNPPLVLSQS
jgi:hypothetical protein